MSSKEENDEVDHVTLQALLKITLEANERLCAMEAKMDAVPHERHNLEHEWIRVDMERKQAQRDFWVDVHKKLATTGIIGAVGLVLSALGYALIQWIQHIRP